MLATLKRAGRRCRPLIWAMALIFALAPAFCVASCASAGVFTGFVVYAHAHDEAGHTHHGYHHHGHWHGGHADHHYDNGTTDNGDHSSGQYRLHVHFDFCCPGLLIPVLEAAALCDRPSDCIAIPPAHPTQGVQPDQLLRPPIS